MQYSVTDYEKIIKQCTKESEIAKVEQIFSNIIKDYSAFQINIIQDAIRDRRRIIK